MAGISLERHPIHLGLGATAVSEPVFTGEMAWYGDYMQRHAADGSEGRLVSLHSFDRPWSSWEMHPEGSEVVVCLQGSITFILEYPDGTADTVTLEAGQYHINPPGVWHTADVATAATVLFITAGSGTEGRAR